VVRISTNLGTGSGVIFEANASDGSAKALTNYHVIEGASSITVVVNDSVNYGATVLGVDSLRDLAVVRICCSTSFQALPFGDVSEVQAGDEVIAIGYALGLEGPATVTRGIVSAIRYMSDADRWVVQTDASINPGNSGGPLLSASGEILGINTYGIRITDARVAVEGFGFAVSEVTIKAVLPGLTAGTPIVFSTPTPVPSALDSIYTSEKYWYSIDIPAGWKVDFSDDDNIVIWDPRTGATLWVNATEISPDVYPTLDSYIADWEPAPGEGLTDFQITSRQRIRTSLPVEAKEFFYTYTLGGESRRAIAHWYILGRYKVSVRVFAVEAVWTLERYAETLNTLLALQESFNPAMYTSDTYGYSLAHPPAWEVWDDLDKDYFAYDPTNASTGVGVQILSASGYSSIQSYGLYHTVIDADISSRQVVFAGRPNPSYRIDYNYTVVDTGRLVRGSVLITLVAGNAIWVFVDDYAENWTEIQNLVDEIFLRVAVSS
jgi:hypothetical protein